MFIRNIIIIILFGLAILIIGNVFTKKTVNQIEEEKTKPENVKECILGKEYIDSLGKNRYRTIGVEEHTVKGKTMDLCCSEGIPTTPAQEEEKLKICSDMRNGGDYSITWVANEKTKGEYIKIVEIYLKGNSSCMETFTLEGGLRAKKCIPLLPGR